MRWSPGWGAAARGSAGALGVSHAGLGDDSCPPAPWLREPTRSGSLRPYLPVGGGPSRQVRWDCWDPELLSLGNLRSLKCPG